ncbi:MAG: hypothetical protein ACI8S6_005974, partial [Myxococcota bacterium]
VDCAVQTVFEGFSQRTLVDEDWTEFQDLRDIFVDTNQSIRATIRALVLSETFRSAGSTDPDENARLAGVKMVSPAQLSSIVEDITDYRWDFGGTDGLANISTGLPVLLGGLDSTVTERSYEPSVGAVFIQERLAQSAAWHVANHDLDVTRTDDAIMLAYVTHEDRPSHDSEAFEAQIRSLYLQATGLPLGEEAEEPEALMQLWEQLYALEASPTAAWAGVVSAVLRDPRVLTY